MVHMNVEDNTPEYIPDFHFPKMAEENLSASIKARMFGDHDFSVETNNEDSLADSLNKESDKGLLFIHNHTLFQKGYINPNWILLEMGSSIEMFCNIILLKNIHRMGNMTKIHCTAEVVNITHKGTIPGY